MPPCPAGGSYKVTCRDPKTPPMSLVTPEASAFDVTSQAGRLHSFNSSVSLLFAGKTVTMGTIKRTSRLSLAAIGLALVSPCLRPPAGNLLGI